MPNDSTCAVIVQLTLIGVDHGARLQLANASAED
jgi:hypothetical protein